MSIDALFQYWKPKILPVKLFSQIDENVVAAIRAFFLQNNLQGISFVLYLKK